MLSVLLVSTVMLPGPSQSLNWQESKKTFWCREGLIQVTQNRTGKPKIELRECLKKKKGSRIHGAVQADWKISRKKVSVFWKPEVWVIFVGISATSTYSGLVILSQLTCLLCKLSHASTCPTPVSFPTLSLLDCWPVTVWQLGPLCGHTSELSHPHFSLLIRRASLRALSYPWSCAVTLWVQTWIPRARLSTARWQLQAQDEASSRVLLKSAAFLLLVAVANAAASLRAQPQWPLA